MKDKSLLKTIRYAIGCILAGFIIWVLFGCATIPAPVFETYYYRGHTYTENDTVVDGVQMYYWTKSIKP